MRIAQVAPYFTPHIGGVESHVLELSRELVRRGHEVTVLTSLLEDTKESESIDGIRVRRVKQLANIFTTPITPALKKISTEEFDLVHAHTPPPLSSYYIAKACKRYNTPFILTYHCDLEIPYPLGRIIVELYRLTLGSATVKKARKIIVTTRSYAATSRMVWMYDPVVIPNAVNAVRFNPEISGKEIRERYNLEEKKVVLYVGRIAFHKGLEYLIQSASLVDDETRYLIVGGGKLLEKYKKLAKSLAEKVIFTGKVPDEDLPKYYRACDVFVLPSVSRLEAFGIVALEAMASGKAVVISDIPGVREVVEDGVEGLYVVPMSSEDLARKISEILDNDDLREKLGRNARKKVEEQFTWEKIVEQFEDVYDAILSSKYR